MYLRLSNDTIRFRDFCIKLNIDDFCFRKKFVCIKEGSGGLVSPGDGLGWGEMVLDWPKGGNEILA